MWTKQLGRRHISIGLLYQSFSTTSSIWKESLKNAKKFNPSSQKWLMRQINDNYVKEAKLQHYRCRSAFKLLEIHKSYKIFKPGQTVVDLGCAPGSWTQVAVNATQANIPSSGSLVVGVDLSPVHPIGGAILLGAMDFTTDDTQQRVSAALGSRRVDVVLSDMAPAATGIKFMDHTNIVKLCYAALRFAQKTSVEGGSLIMKVFDGNECKQLMTDTKNFYKTVKIVHPNASRKESSEKFFVCLNFMGNQQEGKELNAMKNEEPR